MALTPYSGGTPQRNVRATFSTYMDAWLTWLLDTFMAEINAVVEAMNLNDVSDTSTSSITINMTAGKTATVSAGKGFLGGNFLIFADSAAPTTNYMLVQVVSYSGTTLTFDPVSIEGSGTISDWVISFSAKSPTIGTHKVVVHSGNGSGSTNTKIRRFTTAMTNTGTAITYSDSATLGAKFLINEPGFYSISYSDTTPATNFYLGITLNTTTPTTSITSVAVAERLAIYAQSGASLPGRVSVTVKLDTNDEIRPHHSGSLTETSSVVFLSIEKVGNV